MHNDQLVTTFKATVQASLHGLETLAPILDQEHRALVGRDPGVLESIVKHKLSLLQQLQHSVEARERLQQAAGFPRGNAGGDALVANHGDPGLVADWSQLRDIAAALDLPEGAYTLVRDAGPG